MARDRHGLLARLRRTVKGWTISSPGRDGWQRPDAVIAALGIRPGARIADLGAGTGYFTIRLARATGPTGITYAVDTDEDMLVSVEDAADRAGLANVRAILGTDDGPNLPERVDLAFLCNVYHHLPNQRAYFAQLAPRLAPAGRVAIVEAMPGGVIARLFGHVTPPERIRDDLQAVGYRLDARSDLLEARVHQSFQLFAKADPSDHRATLLDRYGDAGA